MKSKRNKTIDISENEGENYLNKCITVFKKVNVQEIVNKIILGNAFDVIPLLPENFADLIIADPPYNLEKDFHGNKFHKLSNEEYEIYTASWIKQAASLMKPNASIYVCCDWKSSFAVEKALRSFFIVKNRITWQREKGRGAKRNWKNAMEDIWFAVKNENYTFNVDDVKCRRRVAAPYKQMGVPKDWEETPLGNFRNTYPSNFWDDISIPYWSMAENTAHPAQKPEKLLAKLILASSCKGDIVFDPFLGSGSTAVSAKKLERNFCGIEMNPQYCIWTQKRLENADNDKSIQGYADKVFWERNTAAFQKNVVK